MLQSNLGNYEDAYIVVKGTITGEREEDRAIDGYNEYLILKKMHHLLAAYQRSIMY